MDFDTLGLSRDTQKVLLDMLLVCDKLTSLRLSLRSRYSVSSEQLTVSAVSQAPSTLTALDLRSVSFTDNDMRKVVGACPIKTLVFYYVDLVETNGNGALLWANLIGDIKPFHQLWRNSPLGL
jgi:hypothetical protein